MKITYYELVRSYVSENNIQCVTFDLFDTLIFRKTPSPNEIFLSVHDLCNKHYFGNISGREFLNLRLEAHRRAKAKALKQEVQLEDIYNILLDEPEDVRQLIEYELKAEKGAFFLNQSMVALIKALLASSVNVAFISDMYLSASRIRNTFLQSEPELLHLNLFVSGDMGVTKSSGDIFHEVKNALSVDFGNWVHLGDNQDSDYFTPGHLGIKCFLYQAKNNTKKINLSEKKLYSVAAEFNAIREIVCSDNVGKYSNNIYDLGGYVWGPVLLSFADWVIEESLARQGSCILFIMREGQIFKKVVDERIKARGVRQLTTHIVYASRFSTFVPGDEFEENWTDKFLRELIEKRKYTLLDLYENYQLAKDELLDKYSWLLLSQAHDEYFDKKSVLNHLFVKLRKESGSIKSGIETNKIKFKDYFSSLKTSDLSSCITVDFGGGGTIQHQIEKLLNTKALSNLLFYMSERAYRYTGITQFHGFISAHNDTGQPGRNIRYALEAIEPLLLGIEGSTIGYDYIAEKVQPLQSAPIEKNIPYIKTFEQGVLDFVACFHAYGFKSISDTDAAGILARYVYCPTGKEAEVFMELQQQLNDGVSYNFDVISKEQLELATKEGIQNLVLNTNLNPGYYHQKLYWPMGLAALINEEALFKCKGVSLDKHDVQAREIVEKIKLSGWTHGSIYCAGEMFSACLPYLMDLDFEINSIVDRKAELENYSVHGLVVEPLEKAMLDGNVKFVICSYAYVQEIVREINGMANTLNCQNEIELIYLS